MTSKREMWDDILRNGIKDSYFGHDLTRGDDSYLIAISKWVDESEVIDDNEVKEALYIDRDLFKCPSCQLKFRYVNIVNYCSNCGQRIVFKNEKNI